MPILDLAKNLIPELKKKTANEWAGPCPVCGGSDRFVVWVDKNAWFCRGCDKSGDEVSFLRLFGRSCPEAHAELGKKCESFNCAIKDTCHYRNGGNVAGQRRHVEPKSLQAPAASSAGPAFEPQPAQEPRDKWRGHAAKLISHAHDELLSCPELLRYLEGRGLDLEAVKKYRLGWLKKDAYRERTSWGLDPNIKKATGKPTKLWFPAGIVIPFFDSAGLPLRIRIRRAEIGQGQQRYYWVPGSGNDVPIIGAGSGGSGARAFAVVESDLDALLVHHCAGDLVNVIPLGTAAAKPKQEAFEALSKALCILVALDNDAAGARAAKWWLHTYPRAVRWPVPVGKDPGEFVEKHGGDVRVWVLAGLPPGLAVEAAPADCSANDVEPGPEPEVEWIKGVSKGGIHYVVAETPQQLADARRAHPDAAPFLRSELKHLQNHSPEALHQVLQAKLIMPEGVVVDSRGAA